MLASCVSRVEGPGQVAPAASPTDPMVAGALVVEQFLRAANANDIDTMSRLFGTKQGPVARLWTKQQVEDQLYLLANVLKHENYGILRSEVVPGRRDEATSLIVQMTVRGRQVEVPYTLVWSDDRTWLIENIDLTKVTGR
jgi:hypothetical protein